MNEMKWKSHFQMWLIPPLGMAILDRIEKNNNNDHAKLPWLMIMLHNPG